MRRLAPLAVGLLAVLIAAAPSTAATGLAGRWTFDETSGVNAADATGGGHAGTLSGGVQRVAGKQGAGALAFDGGGGQVRVPTAAGLETPNVTVEAWVRRSGSPGAFKHIVAKGASGCMAASYALYSGPNGGIQFYVSSGAGSSFTRSPDGGPGIWDGQWHLVTGSFDGATVRLYVDGAEVGSGTPASDPIDYGALGTRDLFVGHYDGCAAHDFDGSVDDVRIYGRALSAGEVAAEPAFAFNGFFKPVDNLPTVNVAKAGSAVPVQFSLGGFQGLTGLMATGSPASQRVACDTNAPQDALEATAAPGASTLSYDASSDTYTYVWKTDKSWAATCRELVVTLSDGVPHAAAFKFK
jgi:hypothetical protein